MRFHPHSSGRTRLGASRRSRNGELISRCGVFRARWEISSDAYRCKKKIDANVPTQHTHKEMWTRPVAQVLRSGFEITGYAFARSSRSWMPPVAQTSRNGFEITGYALLASP